MTKKSQVQGFVIDVERFGIQYKGKLVKNYNLRQLIDKKIIKGQEVWIPGKKTAEINGKKVPWKDGQKIAVEAHRFIEGKNNAN